MERLPPIPFPPGVEEYRGYGFQVFQHEEFCEGCAGKPGQWNGNMYQKGWHEPIGYCFESLESEAKMRDHLKGRIDKLIENKIKATEKLRERYRTYQAKSGLEPDAFRKACEERLRRAPEGATPEQWVHAAKAVAAQFRSQPHVSWGMMTKRGFYTGD